ncbi:MAG: Asp-tRNA(Asn)/Glu-tRNA(Gln) amidotransferase subunit GatC [Chitinophagaceae bacterium]|nr:Asp-tRNA(Asn)/Glu-tRNA(Gln) amidotransferase subunit GatC [Chitinophagaceae bacterium]
MEIDKKILYKIADLARLEIDPEKEEELLQKMNSMVEFIEHLQKMDTENVEPLINMSFEINNMRKDEAKDYDKKEYIFKNAPQRENDYFQVSKIIPS